MSDREKVIKGLEACIKRDCRENACPYGNMSHGCLNALYTDALELLKAVEPYTNEEGTCSCGNCMETVGYYPVGSNDPVELCNFCPNCGKAVKWGW